jgi:hypothetical protein
MLCNLLMNNFSPQIITGYSFTSFNHYQLFIRHDSSLNRLNVVHNDKLVIDNI